MKYLSICSGIEAATVAWHPIGWTPVAFAETEAFPRAVLAHHYPNVPNFGDVNRWKDWPHAAFDVLVGGTPCQSFSVAGLRRGMADPRGNLTLVYLAIADRYRPEWIVWENVPGVLSSNEGQDFGAFIGGLGELGYHAAWRVLDAQYVRVDGFARAVPQRRRRVFVVGHLGDWRRTAAVLFEREGMQGHPAPRRQAGERAAGTIEASLGRSRGAGTPPGAIAPVAKPVLAGGHANNPLDETVIAHALRADGFDASEEGTGRGTPLVAVDCYNGAIDGDVSHSVRAGNGTAMGGVPAIAFDARQSDVIHYGDMTGPLDTDGHTMAVAFAHQAGGDHTSSGAILDECSPTLQRQQTMAVQSGWAVRRLTPLECERLQGFPDGYTAVPYRGKPASDGPRYKALGNSMAVNVMRWIGRRLEHVDGIVRARVGA